MRTCLSPYYSKFLTSFYTIITSVIHGNQATAPHFCLLVVKSGGAMPAPYCITCNMLLDLFRFLLYLVGNGITVLVALKISY